MRQLAAALALFAALNAHAAPPTAESVDRLLAASNVEAMMESFYGAMEQIMRQALVQAAAQHRIPPEQKRVMDQLPAKYMKLMREEYGWSSMKADYVRLYQETFSQEEIDGLIAFYESPTGRSLLAKMPVVIQRSADISQQKMATMMPKIAKMVDEAIREASGAR